MVVVYTLKNKSVCLIVNSEPDLVVSADIKSIFNGFSRAVCGYKNKRRMEDIRGFRCSNKSQTSLANHIAPHDSNAGFSCVSDFHSTFGKTSRTDFFISISKIVF